MTVTPEKIAVALGRTVPSIDAPEYEQWTMWIADALMLIEARLGDPTGLDPAKLDYVVREAVVGHVRRPDDATQVSVSVDDGSTSRTYRSGKGRVTISDDLWNLLSPDSTNGGAFSIRPYPTASTHPPFCSLYFGGTCSCGVSIAGYPIYEGAEW